MTKEYLALFFLAAACLMAIDGVVLLCLKRGRNLTPFAVAGVCALVFVVLQQP